MAEFVRLMRLPEAVPIRHARPLKLHSGSQTWMSTQIHFRHSREDRCRADISDIDLSVAAGLARRVLRSSVHRLA
jgi:DICT domain-containing protein